jgi:transposase
MSKRIYRAVLVKQVVVQDLLKRASGRRLALGCDAAKDKWYGVWMDEEREVLRTMRWDVVDDCGAVLELCDELRKAGVQVEVAAEPTGSYADAMVGKLLDAGFPIYRVSAKHVHDYQEIYDGVPSGHDAKSAAIVAKLHLDRGKKSRRWERQSPERRELRVAADNLDWIKQEEQRCHNRLESRLARFWPELSRVLDLTTVSAVELLVAYGGPEAVSNDAEQVQQSLRQWSRGRLDANRRAQVVEVARQSIGERMIEPERKQVQMLAGQLKKLRQERKQAEGELQQHCEAIEDLAPVRAMVGTSTAGVLLARLGDLREYDSVRALWRAPGLNLREHSSGKKKGQLTITKRGCAVARRWLYLAALRWLQTDAVAAAWYRAKLERNGDRRLKGVVALMRKLLAALYHVARGKQYDAGKLFDCKRLGLAA